MAEQAKLITDDDFWQKRKCSVCGEYRYDTGYGGEIRKWRGNHCPECNKIESRNQARKKRKEHADGYHGAYAASMVYRRHVALASMYSQLTDDEKEQVKKAKAYWKVVRRHGITKWEWLVLFYAQGGMCAICGCGLIVHIRRVMVDHDHATGKVRGLLCAGCNVKMAALDDPGWLEKGQDYKRRTS